MNSNSNIRVLIIDDSESYRIKAEKILCAKNCTVLHAKNWKDAKMLLTCNWVDGIILDINLPDLKLENKNGIDLIPWIIAHNPLSLIWVVTIERNDYESEKNKSQFNTQFENVVFSLKDEYNEITNFIRRIRRIPSLMRVSDPIKQSIKLLNTNLDKAHLEDPFIFVSEEMIDILNIISDNSYLMKPILIYGETGTGKTYLANLIHYLTRSNNLHLAKFDCGHFDNAQFFSELCGARKGSYTHSTYDRIGFLEEQVDNSATNCFIDELQNIDYENQGKLLNILRDRIFVPSGRKEKRINTRIISATNLSTVELEDPKKFRRDLKGRFTIILRIPPINQRPADIIAMFRYFFAKYYSLRFNSYFVPQLAMGVPEQLLMYSYPENASSVSRLAIECVRTMQKQNVLLVNDIDKCAHLCRMEYINHDAEKVYDDTTTNLQETLVIRDIVTAKEVRNKYIEWVLSQNKGNVTRTARLVNLNANTIRSALKKKNN